MKSRIRPLLAAIVLIAAGCTGGGGTGAGSTAPASPEPWRGGTLRLALVQDFSADLDPQQAYTLTPEWEVLRCCLLRTLFSYNGRSVSEGGVEARPDLAAGPPEVAPDGLSWTIQLKEGVHYAPPLEDVEILAQDVVRALMWEASPGSAASYAFYFSVIDGFDEYASGDATTISGLETPDEHTLVVRLTRPTGDLPNRLAMVATAPIPPNPYRPDAVFGVADGHPHAGCIQDGVYGACGYGHFLVASGPYMIEGSEDLDLSLPPGRQEPISGFSSPRYEKSEGWEPASPGRLTLVRNPSWDPVSDDLRAAYAERIEIQLGGAVYSLFPSLYRATAREFKAAVEAGTVDYVPDLYLASGKVERYRADPEMEGRVSTHPSGGVEYLGMNVAVPPFDDLHVRRAVAFAIDRAAVVEAMRSDPAFSTWVGPVATHIAWDAAEANLLATFDPYPHSLEQARQEMAGSRYDRDADGLCDARDCRGVLALVNETNFGPAAADEVAASLEAIGIHLQVQVAPWGRWVNASDPRAEVPFTMGMALYPDYPNASTFFGPAFASYALGQESALGPLPLVGARPAQLREWGYEVTSVPNVDDRIRRCDATTGLDQTRCWAELDQYMMEQVVPVVPCFVIQWTALLSERVVSYSYSIALDRISLVPGSE